MSGQMPVYLQIFILVLGGAIAAIFGYIGGYVLEKKKMRLQEERNRITAIDGVLDEIGDNETRARQINILPNLDRMEENEPINYSVDTWVNAKKLGSFSFLDESMVEKLRKLYAQFSKANQVIKVYNVIYPGLVSSDGHVKVITHNKQLELRRKLSELSNNIVNMKELKEIKEDLKTIKTEIRD